MAQDQGFARALLMACDVTAYGSGDDQLQAAMQSGLVKVLDEAATGARLVRSEWDKSSTGDGELALLPATESEPRVVDDFIRELAAALARHNRHLADAARLRLRVAIHYGVAYPASNGYAGHGVVAVSRLLDSAPVREALRQSAAELALILSDGVYSETVLNGHTSLRPRDFRRVAVRIKEFEANAWLWLPHGDVHSLSLSDPEVVRAGPGGPSAAAAEPHVDGVRPHEAGLRERRQEASRFSARIDFNGPVHAEDGPVFGINVCDH